MGKLLLLVAAVLAGVAIWRRNSLQTDAEMLTELAKTNAAKATEAAKSGVAKVKKDSDEDQPVSDQDTPDEATADEAVAEAADA